MSLLQMSFSGSLLILCITVIRLLAQHPLPKTTFLLLWEIAALRLLLPISLPVPHLFPAWTVGEEGQKLLLSAGGVSDETILTTAAAESGLPFLSVLWLLGGVALGLWFLHSYRKGLCVFRMSLPTEEDLVQGWMEEHSLRRPLSVRVSDQIASPLTYGILRPVILLPKATLREPEDVLRCVLTHEFVHVCRFDACTKLLFAAALCVHWWNPLVWLLFVFGNRDIELSCDTAVVHRLGMEHRSEYALVLLRLEEARGREIPLCTYFNQNAMEERIKAIMKWKKASWAAVTAAAVLAVGAVTVFAAECAPEVRRSEGAHV